MDRIVVLSTIAAALAIVNNTLVRKKMWQGWVGSLVGACLFTYVNWLTGAWGYVGLGVFYIGNAIAGIRQWRRDLRAIVVTGE